MDPIAMVLSQLLPIISGCAREHIVPSSTASNKGQHTCCRHISFIARQEGHRSRQDGTQPDWTEAGWAQAYKMISSTALPNVTFNSAPVASPSLRATLSVA